MAQDIENRMAVEGQRYQEELYSRDEDGDDHIIFVKPDGTPVYDERVRYCDIYDCEECPRYGECCDGEEDDDELV